MTETTEARVGLGRLLDELARDGWLVGLNSDADPALSRMDPRTGIYSGEYLDDLIREAVVDARAERRRLLDGPQAHRVGLVEVAVLGWEEILERHGDAVALPLEREVARRLAECLRAEDALGRRTVDRFRLLLRGCDPEHLPIIAGRCASALAGESVVTGAGPIPLGAASIYVDWEGEDPEVFSRRATVALDAEVERLDNEARDG